MSALLKRIKLLTLYLFISGAINILLIAFVFYWTFKDRPYYEITSQKRPIVAPITISPTNAELLKKFKTLRYAQLLLKLNQKALVEDGFTERDLALSILTSFHDFNLEKALNGQFPLEKRLLSVHDGQTQVIAYPGLKEEHFQAIRAFANTEKWPFKSRGLFFLLKKEHLKADVSLHEAFFLTPEFTFLEDLFTHTKVTKEDILTMIQEGEWGLLSAVYEKYKSAAVTPLEKRQHVLLAYLYAQSKNAALLLIKIDINFVVKRLSDETIMDLLKLVESNSEETLRFLSLIAASPRSDQVRKSAINRYQQLSGHGWEPLVSRAPQTATPIIHKTIPIKNSPSIPLKKSRLYTVQEGDSLWKIAKRFSSKVEDIRTINNLKSDFLKTGSSLMIPES